MIRAGAFLRCLPILVLGAFHCSFPPTAAAQSGSVSMTIPLPQPLFWDPTQAGGDYAVVEQPTGLYLLRSATGRVVARLHAPPPEGAQRLEARPAYGPLEYTETLESPAGWPFRPGDEVATVPIVEDLDDDGACEVVFATRSGWLWVLGRDGLPPAGWPVPLGASCTSSPALADLNGDGRPEVVVGDARGRVHAVRLDGTVLRGWPASIPGEPSMKAIYGATVTADIDSDGSHEVIVCQSAGRVCVFQSDGSVRTGWPVATADAEDPHNAGTIFARAAVGDLNGDGMDEIIAAANNYRVHVWDAAGRGLPGWPRKLENRGRAGYAEPVLADLTGDNRPEILIATDRGFNGPPRIYALNAGGRDARGWPVDLPERCNAGVALGDLDGDGKREIVAATIGSNAWVVVVNQRGEKLPGFPVALADMSVNTSPVLADINGDGRVDILLATSRTLFEPAAVIMALDARGRALPAFPIQIDGCEIVSGGGCAADLDGDGLLELVLGTEVEGQVHVWDLHGRAGPAGAPWPRAGFDSGNTGRVHLPGLRPRPEPARPSARPADAVAPGESPSTPFSPLESVSFQLLREGHVRLQIRQVDATPVRTLLDVDLPPGSYTVHWDGRDDRGFETAPGVYFYEVETPGRRATGQLLILR
jgi:hypothetical protein